LGPYQKRLAEEQITTLVFVPDGPLRTIPMAGLLDGERFLVEQYALAVTPGLARLTPNHWIRGIRSSRSLA
jgi:CHAT domain-containing protein